MLASSDTNIANIVSQADFEATLKVTYNEQDTETLPTYGQTSIGLAAAFVSLTSNLCATALVGIKAWYVTMSAGFSYQNPLMSLR